jgi:hypothetical protein
MFSDCKRPRNGDDTERQRAIRASRRHLKDLRAAYARPPADVVLSSRAIPVRIAPVEIASFCSSPANLCAELVK